MQALFSLTSLSPRVISPLLALILWSGQSSALSTVRAAETSPPSAAVPTGPLPAVLIPDDPLGRGTPRGSVEGFFGSARDGSYAQAAQYLNLSALAPETRASRGPELARQLWFVLERRTRIDFSSLSIEPLGETHDGLAPNRERLVQINTARGRVDVSLERVGEPDGLEVWKISSRSVEQIPKLYEASRLPLLERLFPEAAVAWMMHAHFLGLSLVNWLIVTCWVLIWAVLVLVAVILSRRALSRLRPGDTANLLSAIHVPLVVIIVSVLLRSAVPQQLVSEELATLFRGRTVLIAVTVWVLLRLVDFGTQRARARILARDGNTGFHLLDLVRRIAKVTVVVIALIVWLDNMGFKVSTIVASLGIIGLAVGLASQKFMEDLIAAMTLHATGVVKRNEDIAFGNERGAVEDIGLRMIRIRSQDGAAITMPNAAFAAMQIENLDRRDRYLFEPRLGLRYETTPDQLRYVLNELRKLVDIHPRVLKDDDVRVRFVSFGAFSLDVEIFCYVSAVSRSEFLEVAEDLNFKIMDVVAKSGTGFAFPSQTVYFEQGQAPDKPLSPQAQQEIRWRREDGHLNRSSAPPQVK